VAAIINKIIKKKLPSSWNDYKRKLKHVDRKYFLKSLQPHLHIEEDSNDVFRDDHTIANVIIPSLYCLHGR
jgi:hypothetical protein